jgi:hypothetical protein
MAQLTIDFHGICTHLGQAANPDLPVPYRVVVPQSNGPNQWQTFNLGSLTPTLTINDGPPVTGPLILTIAGGSGGPPIDVVPSALPDLEETVPSGITINPAPRAYAASPTGGALYIDLQTSGTMTVIEESEGKTLAARFTTEIGPPITATLSQGNAVTTLTWSQDTAVMVTNSPQNMVLEPEFYGQQVLLGLLAVNPDVPPGSGFPAPIGSLPMLWEPNQPGCSNSQWP